MNLAGLKVGIYGLGLIGGSLARALSSRQAGMEIYGYDRKKERVGLALSDGTIKGELKGKTYGEMDVIVLAVPVRRSLSIGKRIIKRMNSKAVLTDCGSVKCAIFDHMSSYAKGPFFVAGHPVAGTEKAGYENSFAGLYDKRVVFLSPYEETPLDKVRVVERLWEAAGAKAIKVPPAYHDHVFAFVSHLPHIVSYSLVHSVATFDSPLPLGYSAGGFKDFTRIASSDPSMWAEILVENKQEVLRSLRHFKKSLSLLEKMIREEDEKEMKGYFRLSKKKRDSI